MRKSQAGSLILLLLSYTLITCGEKVKNLPEEAQSKKDQIWKIDQNNYTLHIETIDSVRFYKEKKAAKIQSEEIEKISDFKIVKKLLKGMIEFEETEDYAAIKKIHFKNGTSWQSKDDEEIFVAYYPAEDIIVMEGGHSSDISFNLNNGKAIEEAGNPEYLNTSTNKTYRLNGFYDGQECVTYFIEKNIQGQFEKVIPLSEELNKEGKLKICHVDDEFWKDDHTLLLREIQAYGQNGVPRTVFYKITLVNANLPEKKAASKTKVSDFIPKGWKEILRESGDLNGDGIDDEVLVIEDTDPENFQNNDGLGTDKLNLNPRTLLILFKEKNGTYRLGAKNDNGFIESENSEMNSCLADPLLTEGGISITKGLLQINLHYWLSCGSYYVNNSVYTFRFQNNHFALIGFDHNDFHRASGEENSSSINFLTQKKSTTSGGNVFGDNESKPVTTWKKISVKELYVLENLGEDVDFDF